MGNLRPPVLETFKSGFVGNSVLTTNVTNEALYPNDVKAPQEQNQDYYNQSQIEALENEAPMLPNLTL